MRDEDPREPNSGLGTENPSGRLGLLAISNLLGMGFLALFWFVAALIVEKEIVGSVTFYVSIATITASFATLGLGLAEVALFPRTSDNSLIAEFNAAAMVMALLFGLLLGYILLSPLLAFLLVVSQVSFTMTSYNKLARQTYRQFAVWNVLCSLARFTLGALGLLFVLDSMIIAVLYLTPSLVLGIDFLANAARGLSQLTIKHLIINMRMVANLSGVFVLRAFAAYLDKIVTALIAGMIILGEYQFVYQLFALLQFFPSAVLSFTTAENASGVADVDTLRNSLAVSLLLSAGILIFAPPGMLLLIPDYQSVVPTLQIVGLSLIFGTLASAKISLLLAQDRSPRVLQTYVLSLIIQYAVILLLVSRLGLLALGLGLFLGQVVLGTSAFLFTRLNNEKEDLSFNQ